MTFRASFLATLPAGGGQLQLAPRSPTGTAAYAEIVEQGMLPRSEMAVYQLLHVVGPQTRNELDIRLKRGGVVNPNYSRRLSQMERRGVIRRLPPRPCTVTGFMCDVWAITGVLPQPLPPKPASRPSAPALAAAGVEIERGIAAPSANLRALIDWLKAHDIPNRSP